MDGARLQDAIEFGKSRDATVGAGFSRRGVGRAPFWQNAASRHVPALAGAYSCIPGGGP
jgi:hypothetical protein